MSNFNLQEVEQQQSNKTKIITEIYDWLDIIISSVIAVVIIFTLFFRIVTIVGDSMQNTLYNGERIFISDMFYKPKYGDIVVISRNMDNSAKDSTRTAEPIIKRVIATGGQYVDIDFDRGVVSVGYDLGNMTELKEPYTKTPTNREADVKFPLYVEEGYVFVLGDNRNDSKDSRFSEIGEDGLINEKYILGRAVFRILPFDRIGGLSFDE